MLVSSASYFRDTFVPLVVASAVVVAVLAGRPASRALLPALGAPSISTSVFRTLSRTVSVRSVASRWANFLHHARFLADNRLLARGTGLDDALPEERLVSYTNRAIYRVTLNLDALLAEPHLLFHRAFDYVGADAHCTLYHLTLTDLQTLFDDFYRLILPKL